MTLTRSRTDHVSDERFLALAEILERRWMLPVLDQLMGGPARHRAMLAAIRGISDVILTRRLRDLEQLGLASRRLDPDRSVTYELTERGYGLRLVVDAVAECAGDTRFDR
jgi:DNA-binding HxlR family transcriptional regulator